MTCASRLFAAIGVAPLASASASSAASVEDGLSGTPAVSYAEAHARSTSRLERDMNGQRPAYAPMHEHTRAKLLSFFRPYNQRLATLLADKRFEWPPAREGAARRAPPRALAPAMAAELRS
jgi:hypothetical protein